MNTSTLTKGEILAHGISFSRDKMCVALSDGRELNVPMEWFPRLLSATKTQRGHWRLIGGGIGIHWDEIDEDISVEGLLK